MKQWQLNIGYHRFMADSDCGISVHVYSDFVFSKIV